MTKLVAEVAVDSAAERFLAPFVDEALPAKLRDLVLSGEPETCNGNPINPALIGSPIGWDGGWEELNRNKQIRPPCSDEPHVAKFYKDGRDAWIELAPKVTGQDDKTLRIPLKDRFHFGADDLERLNGFTWLHRSICAGLATLFGGQQASKTNRLGADAWDVDANFRLAMYVLKGGDGTIARNLPSLQNVNELDGILSVIAAMDTASRSDPIWTEELFNSVARMHAEGAFENYDMYIGCGAEGLNPDSIVAGAIKDKLVSADEFIKVKREQLDVAQSLGIGRVCFPSVTLDGLSPRELIDIHKNFPGNEDDRWQRAALHALGGEFLPGTGYFEGAEGEEVLRSILGEFSFLKTSRPLLSSQIRYMDIAKDVDGRICTGDDYNTPLVLALGAKRFVDSLERGRKIETKEWKNGCFVDSPLVAGGLLGNINISPRQFIAGMWHLSNYVHESAAGNAQKAKEHMTEFFDIWAGYMAASCFFFFGPRNPTRAYTGHIEAAYRLRGVLTDADAGHVLPSRDYYHHDDVSRRLTDGTVLMMLAAAREITIEDVQAVIEGNRDRVIARVVG